VGLEAGGELTVQVPKLPEEQKSTFELIWEGLSKLPGAVYRGVKPHVGEISRGVEFGFKAAGIVMIKSAYLILEDVVDAIDSGAWESAGILLEKPLERKFGKRKAIFSVVGLSAVSLAFGRYEAKNKIEKRFYELRNSALEINDEIIKIGSRLVERFIP
jgi:hypothetical protein